MKKLTRNCLLLMTSGILMLALAGCGGNPEKKAADGSAVTELSTPANLHFTQENEEKVLSWDAVEDAAGYRIYISESRYTDEKYELTDKAITGNTIAKSEMEKLVAKLDARDTFAGIPYPYYSIVSVNGEVESEPSERYSEEMEIFGENIYIFSPKDNAETVNGELKRLFMRMERAQFDDRRYAVMFKPGVYDESIETKMGFYMDVMGLGFLPTDTVIPNFNCPATWLGDAGNHNATCNFWRGVSNLTVDDNVMWAVSQATFMRRMQINGNLYLHDNNGWSSGGFLSDSVIDGLTDSGSQQQWLSRNCDWKYWTGQNWNIVFAGIEEGKTPLGTWPATKYTTLETTGIQAEKPFLYLDEDGYKVYLPEIRYDTKGISWKNQSGRAIDLTEFYVAHAGTDTADTLNVALAEGKHILLTPGIYEIDKAVEIKNPDTIFLGIGYATLRPTAGTPALEVADVDGVRIAGILFDAWKEKSETLLRVGEEGASANHSANPIVLNDTFFRVGGVTPSNTSVDSCVIINSNNVVGDNFWVWRADHGSGVSWTANYAKNGIIVNGDDVTIYALMVEHFMEYQTVWNGENGTVVFYQSELPYDVPKQSEWVSEDGKVNGFASYYVNLDVATHNAYGIGIYSYNRDAVVEEYCAMRVPEVLGMNLINVCDVMITGNPGISHVINGYGSPAYSGGTRSIITNFQKELEKAAK
ncbi:MAG: sialidase [Acetatifactor sp.]|nr:sialidase [Acetatifactor sp.]